MTHVGAVLIEAFDLIQHASSIYGQCIYRQRSTACADRFLAVPGIRVTEKSGVVELYQAALEMEKGTRDHFKKLARELPEGLEKELCEELAAEEEVLKAPAGGMAED